MQTDIDPTRPSKDDIPIRTEIGIASIAVNHPTTPTTSSEHPTTQTRHPHRSARPPARQHTTKSSTSARPLAQGHAGPVFRFGRARRACARPWLRHGHARLDEKRATHTKNEAATLRALRPALGVGLSVVRSRAVRACAAAFLDLPLVVVDGVLRRVGCSHVAAASSSASSAAVLLVCCCWCHLRNASGWSVWQAAEIGAHRCPCFPEGMVMSASRLDSGEGERGALRPPSHRPSVRLPGACHLLVRSGRLPRASRRRR